MKRLRVAVLMGGPSSEREVSMQSGRMVIESLQPTGAVVLPVEVVGTDFSLPGNIDVAFIAMHGAFGEDGHLQQILEERGIPYTGSDPGSSARAFDKVLAKECFIGSAIPTPDYTLASETLEGVDELHWPLVVKPSRQGSSVGVSIVKDRAALRQACQQARQYDGQILIEQFVRGRELTVGILGQQTLPVIEIRTHGGFFDYKAKYTTGEAEEIVPAPLDSTTASRAQLLAMRAHESLGCRDFSRVDMMLSEQNEIFVLEVNTIPGMTPNSLLPKAAQAAGLNRTVLCTRMIEMALARRTEAVAA